MFKFILQVLALMLFICALGCNKNGNRAAENRDGASAELRQPADIKPGDAGQGNIEINETVGSGLPNPEDEKKLRDELIVAFEKDGFKYAKDTDSITGSPLPEGGVSVANIVPLVYSEAINQGGANDPAIRAKAITTFKSRFIAMIQAKASDPEAAKAVMKDFEGAGELMNNQAVDPAAAMAVESLRFCVDPVGEWKSTKEVLDADAEVRVEHNDQYYKLLQIFYSGICRYQEFREGKIVSDGNYPWTFDKATGKLQLRTADGSVFEELLIMDRPSEKKLIYVKGMQDYQYTVYEKVGSGNKPRTEEDLKREAAEFEEAKRKLSGSEGSTATDPENKSEGGKGKEGDK
ncbi:hypothetical protein IT575_09925 [bacterium]|nr:hypothetical protein [bacterium]